MAVFTDLPEDVVYELLTALPDLATLSATIRLSKKHTYRVFQEHKRSVLYAVASNLLGPCLLHAFRLLWHILRQPCDALPTTDAVADTLRSFTCEQRKALEKVGETANGLEALFSQT